MRQLGYITAHAQLSLEELALLQRCTSKKNQANVGGQISEGLVGCVLVRTRILRVQLHFWIEYVAMANQVTLIRLKWIERI